MKFVQITIIIFLFSTLKAIAQDDEYVADVNIRYTFSVENNDTLFHGYIHNVTIFTPMIFRNEKERMEYNKLIRDVKKTLPYAKSVSASIIETYEFMQTLPNEKAKQKHLENVQKFMMDEYKPKMKKLTRNQGKILIKLVDRECNSTSYNIIKSLVGSFKAGVYNVFAGIFGNSLKTEYDPEGKDKMIERVATLVEEGIL